MAVVDEYYSSRLELGPPAMVAYMAGFMGERERMNRAIIDQMLAQKDPKVLAETERDARRSLNELLKLKAQVGMATGKANTDIIKALLQYRASERGSQAREAAAVTAARGAFAKSYMYQEGRKQEAIAAGRDAAAKGSATATAPSNQTYSGSQQEVNSYQQALDAAKATTKVGEGNLVGFGGKAAELKLAEDALAAAKKAGHTSAAAWIQQTYFSGKEPSTYYQESDFRPKTEEEILKVAANIPNGGKGGLAPIVKMLESDLSMDPGEVGKLVYGTVQVDGKTLEQRYGPPTQDALDEAGAAAVVTGGAPVGAGTGEIDAAIADVKKQIQDLQAQRGTRPSLQQVAASRYPNYLYTNPFQVRSRKFDQFQDELGRLSPRGRERYMEAMDRAPEVLPSVFARRDLERTEPADIPAEGFRFAEEGVDTSAPGEAVAAKVAELLKKTQEVFAQPVQIGNRGDTVQFVTRNGKQEVKIAQKDGKTVYAPAGSKTYAALLQQVSDKAPEVSGLTAYMNTLPDSVGERELAPVYKALTSGGYAAAEAEAGRLAEEGDVGLHQVYARELEEIAGDPDAVKRNDRLEALRGKVPEGVSWKKALDRVIDAKTIETATTGAGELSRALRDAFPEGLTADLLGEEATRFATRAAQEEERKRQVRGPVPAATTEDLPTVESLIGPPPIPLASKKEREDYAKKKAGLDTLRKNNKGAYLELVREERATRGAKAPGELVQGAPRDETAARPSEKEQLLLTPANETEAQRALSARGQLRTMTATETGAQRARSEVAAKALSAREKAAAAATSSGLLPEQEDLQADLVASMLGFSDTPDDRAYRAARQKEVDAYVSPEAARAGGVIAQRRAELFPAPTAPSNAADEARKAAAVKKSAEEQAAYKARKQPGRSGPLPAPRAAAPVTKADLDAVDAALMGMPVPAAPARTPAKTPPAAPAAPAKTTGTGTMGTDREKKTPPPAAKKAKQKAEDDADALDN